MKTPFVKMHGNGNDFVIIDNFKQNFRKDITLIKKIAKRDFKSSTLGGCIFSKKTDHISLKKEKI